MNATIGVTDPWDKRVRVPIHPDRYGNRLFVAGYSIAWGALAIFAQTWEDAWEVWLEQQQPAELEPEDVTALERGESVERLDWADGVGWVLTADLILSEYRRERGNRPMGDEQ